MSDFGTLESRVRRKSLLSKVCKPEDTIKFFTPDSQWSWYPTEFDGNDILFGLVSGLEVELGYFSLSELESVRGELGLPIERDLYYEPHTMDELREYHDRINRY